MFEVFNCCWNFEHCLSFLLIHIFFMSLQWHVGAHSLVVFNRVLLKVLCVFSDNRAGQTTMWVVDLLHSRLIVNGIINNICNIFSQQFFSSVLFHLGASITKYIVYLSVHSVFIHNYRYFIMLFVYCMFTQKYRQVYVRYFLELICLRSSK